MEKYTHHSIYKLLVVAIYYHSNFFNTESIYGTAILKQTKGKLRLLNANLLMKYI